LACCGDEGKRGLKNGRLDAPIMEMELANCGASLLYYSLPVALAMDVEGVLAEWSSAARKVS